MNCYFVGGIKSADAKGQPFEVDFPKSGSGDDSFHHFP